MSIRTMRCTIHMHMHMLPSEDEPCKRMKTSRRPVPAAILLAKLSGLPRRTLRQSSQLVVTNAKVVRCHPLPAASDHTILSINASEVSGSMRV